VARADSAATGRAAPVPIDLPDVVLEEAARASGRLVIDTSGVTGGVVDGRREDLARAVRNLLGNACRHAASTVAAEVRSADGTVTSWWRTTARRCGPSTGNGSSSASPVSTRPGGRRAERGGTGLGLANQS
jgi:signal transduction histidine kinase